MGIRACILPNPAIATFGPASSETKGRKLGTDGSVSYMDRRPLSADENKFVRAVFEFYRAKMEGPRVRMVERQLVREMEHVDQVIAALRKKRLVPSSMEDVVQLPASVLKEMPGLEEPFDVLVRSLPILYDTYLKAAERPELSSEALQRLGWSTNDIRRLGRILKEQHLLSGSGSYSPDMETWQMEVRPAIRHLHTAKSAREYFERAANLEGNASRPQTEPKSTLPLLESSTVSVHAIEDGPISTGDDDRLNFKPYAEALASLISHPVTKPPLVVAINGEWGIGKSSLARMVQEILDRTPIAGSKPHLTTWFNAWMHDDADHLEAALLAHVARAVHKSEPTPWPIRRPLPISLLTLEERRTRLLLIPLAVLVIAACFLPVLLPIPAIAAYLGLSSPENFVGLALAMGGVVIVLIVRGIPVLQSLTAYVWGPELQAKIGGIAKTRSELHRFLDDRLDAKMRLVIFIDDLDRCNHHQALRLLESLNQLLAHSRIIVVLMADLEKVAAQVAAARPEYQAELGYNHEEGRAYLEKIIQLQFDVPRQPRMHLRKFFANLVEPEPPAKDDGRRVRSQLKQWWKSVRREWRALAWLDYNVSLRNPIRFSRDRPLGSLIGWLAYEAGWFIGAILAQTRWTWLPRVARPSFVPPPKWGRIGLRALVWALLLIAYSGAVYWLLGQFLADSPAIRGIALLILLFPVWIWLMILPYGIPAALVIGTMAGLAVRRGIFATRNETKPPVDVKDQQASILIGQIRADLDRNKRFRDLNDSQTMERATNQAIAFFDSRPRFVKRALNRLRLVLFIAKERGILKPHGPISPEAAGKWVVFAERWPDVYKLVIGRPELLGELETGDVGVSSIVSSKRAEELSAFLQTGPSLGSVAYNLSHFEANTDLSGNTALKTGGV